MKVVCIVVAVCCILEAYGFPYYPYYGSNMDSLSYGSDTNHGALVYSRFYQPNYNPRAINAGLATVMYQPPQPQSSGYYTPDRRRQTTDNLSQNYDPNGQKNEANPQQNEIIPQRPDEQPITVKSESDISEKDIPTTVKSATPELVEPEIDDLDIDSKKRVSKKKVTEEEDEESVMPKMPNGMMFPMFFGWGGRSAGGAPGVTAVANAYSTGRGGVATSHATAYGPPRPDLKY